MLWWFRGQTTLGAVLGGGAGALLATAMLTRRVQSNG